MFLDIPIESLFVTPRTPINKVISKSSWEAKRIALVVNRSRRLLSVITDGDIRKAVLRKISLSSPIEVLMKKSFYSRQEGVTDREAREIFSKTKHRHLPVLNKKSQVVDLICLASLDKNAGSKFSILITAGGYGSRLRPLTEDTPKPMLPVGGKPVLEHIIEHLLKFKIGKIYISTHYKKRKITEYFKDGSDFGVNIEYIKETRPLGTAGALMFMNIEDFPLLVINGDILTKLCFKSMWEFHQDHDADMTVGVKEYDFKIPYGVIETDGEEMLSVNEKPVHKLFINSGIYLLGPSVYKDIPRKEKLNMTELLEVLLSKKKRVISFPISEHWLDIGRHSDYEMANNQYGKKVLIK